MSDKKKPAKIKFINEEDTSSFSQVSARVEMHLPQGADKFTLYEYFLDFVRGCGYHVDNGVALEEVETDPGPDPYYTRLEEHNEALEEQNERLEDRIRELEAQLAPAEELLAEFKEEEEDEDGSDS